MKCYDEMLSFTGHISYIKNKKIPKQKIITKPLSCVCISIAHLLYRNFHDIFA